MRVTFRDLGRATPRIILDDVAPDDELELRDLDTDVCPEGFEHE